MLVSSVKPYRPLEELHASLYHQGFTNRRSWVIFTEVKV